MKTKLKTYDIYKVSNILWNKNTPSHWKVVRTKEVFFNKKILNKNNLCDNVLSLTLRGVVNNNINNPEGLVPKDYNSYQLFYKDDLVFKLIDLENFKTSRVGLVHENGIMSSAYIRLTAKNSVKIKYFYYQFFDLYLRGVFNALGSGVRSTLGASELLNLPIVFPPINEQDKIAKFLDSSLSKIQRFIIKKKRLIALLKEQKQVIISQAVTKGLDPNTTMKPSGVEWLGDIPEHWNVSQIGHLAKVGNGSTPSRGISRYWAEDGYPWLNSSCVNQGIITRADQFVTQDALKECHLPIVSPYSILMGITGQGKTRGTVAILTFEATINQHMVFITPDERTVSHEYLYFYLTGRYNHIRAISDNSGSTKGALTCQDVKHLKIPIPPCEEQTTICQKLNVDLLNINKTIDFTIRQIELTTEYRTRIISDVVTGKVNVRNVEIDEILQDTDAEFMDNDMEGLDDSISEGVDDNAFN